MWSVWLISPEVYEFVNDFENSPIIELFSESNFCSSLFPKALIISQKSKIISATVLQLFVKLRMSIGSS